MGLFNRDSDERIYKLEVILGAILELLDRKGIITRGDIQLEILREEEDEEDST